MRGLLARIYAYKALDDLILIYPLYAVMFVDAGVSPSQLAVLLSVWSAVGLLLEVPSGVLADHTSRRRLLMLGQAIRAAGYACWLLFPNFWGFMAGFVCWGIKGALQSGTFEALVYDELDRRAAADQYAKVLGRARAAAIVAILAAMLIAAPAQRLGGYPLLLWFSIAAVLASGVLAFLLPEAPRRRSTVERDLLLHVRLGLREAVTTPGIRRPMLVLATALTLGGSLDEFWGVYGQEAGLSRDAIPIYYAATYAAAAVAAAMAHRLSGLKSVWFYGLIAVAGAALMVAAGTMSAAGMLLLAAFTALTKLVEVNFDARMQHAIAMERRATVSSFAGFLWGGASIAVYLAFGEIAERWGYAGAFMTFGVAAVAAGAVFASSRAFRRV